MPDTRASGWPLETPDVDNPATFPEVVDRDVEHPTRVSVNPVATSPAPFVADLGDEGGEGEAGTPIDAALFEAVHTYVDAGDKAAREEAVSSAQATAQTLDGIVKTQLEAYADSKASEEATAKADAARSAAEAHADEGDAVIQAQVDSIVETGTAAMQPSTVEAIAGGTPAGEVDDHGFAERFAVSALWEAIEAKIEEARKTVLLAVHPVGSYYWSSDPTDPSELFGGEWEAVKDRFVWAKGDSDAVGATGGSKTVALTVAQMPAHSHTVNSHTHTTPNHTHTWANENNNAWSGNQTLTSSRALFGGVKKSGEQGLSGVSGYGFFHDWAKTTAWMASSGGGTSGAAAPATNSVGSGSAHENMPPYVAAHCWRRVA